MNIFQRIAADTYGDGDFSYIANSAQAQNIGDSLFTFIINELSTDEGCEDRETALARLDTAIRDIQKIQNRVENLT